MRVSLRQERHVGIRSIKLVNFSANLRYLCEKHGSISNVCRKLSINRQQFNKYLSGSHAPSPQNMRNIANYFGVNSQLLFSAPDEFRGLVDGNFFKALEVLGSSSKFAAFFESVNIRPQTEDEQLFGVYDRYQYSSIYEARVLKSTFCIYRSGNFIQHYYVERFPSYDDPSRVEYTFKYHGFLFPIADRLFSVDFEAIQKNEITTAIYTPVRRNSTKFLFGIATGIAATMFRQPFATRSALHFRGPGLIRREHLTTTTVLDADNRTIPTEVRQFLEGGNQMIRT